MAINYFCCGECFVTFTEYCKHLDDKQHPNYFTGTIGRSPEMSEPIDLKKAKESIYGDCKHVGNCNPDTNCLELRVAQALADTRAESEIAFNELKNSNFNLLQRIKGLESVLARETLLHGNARRMIVELEVEILTWKNGVAVSQEKKITELETKLAEAVDLLKRAHSQLDYTGVFRIAVGLFIDSMKTADAHKRKDGEG